MRHVILNPRENYKQILNSLNFTYHTKNISNEPFEYWLEGHAYEFKLREIEEIKNATIEINEMFLYVADKMIKNGKYPVNSVFNGDNIYSSAYANTTFTINVPDDGNKSDNNKSNIVPFNNNSNIDNNSIIMNDNMPKAGNPITLLFAVLCILGLICKRKH